MKNKKHLYGLIIFVMVLVLGVGYAVVSSVDLTITGTAGTETKNLDVVISAASPNDTSADVYGTVTNPAGLTATIHVANMQAVGETQTVTYTITNNETDVAASILKKTITVDKSEFFSVTTSVDSNPVVAQANGTATVTVTVTLIKMPIEAADSTANITVTLTASAVQGS